MYIILYSYIKIQTYVNKLLFILTKQKFKNLKQKKKKKSEFKKNRMFIVFGRDNKLAYKDQQHCIQLKKNGLYIKRENVYPKTIPVTDQKLNENHIN